MIPFEEWGLGLVAHFYNQNAKRHNGKVEAVFTSKEQKDCEIGTCVLDLERSIMDGICSNPWQTDTCIGSWHYNRPIFEERRYKSPKTVLDMLVDIVSRNGNLLLNFPLPNSGELDSEELNILSEITKWMAINGEGIYDTRPWKILGEGPSMTSSSTSSRNKESSQKPLSAEDIRFTTKGKTLYAFFMGWPEKQSVIGSLATNSKLDVGKIRNVTLLGFKGDLKWVQDENGLKVQMPSKQPCNHAFTLRITGV
jgi:alpha-L-fucosidase